MTRGVRSIGSAVALLMAVSAVSAQTSLFNQPVASETAAPDKPKPKRAGAAKVPVPARSLVISNASKNVLTELEVSAEDKSAKLSKPLAPDSKVTLRLPAFKSCTVTIVASFENAGQADESSYDICKDKSIRFTD